MSYFHNKKVEKWNQWKAVGFIDGAKFFKYSHPSVQNLFRKRKKLFAKYDPMKQTWFLTVIKNGENRFPRISWKYIPDNSKKTEEEVLEWGEGCFCKLPIKRMKSPNQSISEYIKGFIYPDPTFDTLSNTINSEQIIAQQNLKYYLDGL